MPLLDTIKKMQQQGMNEEQIIQNLKGEGFPPDEINQALEQSKIKAAVSDENQEMPIPAPQNQQQEKMQPSLMETYPPEQEQTEMSQEQTPTQIPQEQTETQPQQEETPEYIYPTPQVYGQEYQEYQPYSTTSPETMTDIAEQMAEEKINALKKKLGNIAEFKATTMRKIENIDIRLKKIEETIDKLQANIIAKIGSYGENLESIREEMGMMQESFSKTLPSIIKKRKHTAHKPVKKSSQKKTRIKKSKKTEKAGIEHYLKR